MEGLKKTALHGEHTSLGAKMAEFGGWDMPIQYPTGIITEHLNTRKQAGIFDVSHMGRFVFSGPSTVPFLQHVLTNNCAGLMPDQAQYTIIQNENGGAIDDAYLYRFVEDEWMLVVNASNREKDWNHFQEHASRFPDLKMRDATSEISMISLQGPQSRNILEAIMTEGAMPEPLRNATSEAKLGDIPVRMGRTGYTGEPICFEFFVNSQDVVKLWRLLQENGAMPIGLGARDTLRLEAAMPLYGHELGVDSDGKEIPVFAIALSGFAVSLSPLKGDFLGRKALESQQMAKRKILHRDYSDISHLPRRIRPFEILDKGLARQGANVYKDGRFIGWVTSGTAVPYWISEGQGIDTVLTDNSARRSLGLAYIDSDILKGDEIEIEVRSKRLKAVVMVAHIRTEAPPYCYPILSDYAKAAEGTGKMSRKAEESREDALILIKKTMENTRWRQQECLNFIPSEMTISSASRMLSIMDPVGRYAEHKKIKAFKDHEVFYYQGTQFIHDVEVALNREMSRFLDCQQIESRVVSGQMANTAVFSAMLELINRGNRKVEPARMSCVMNNHIIRGGHLSAQPMGALKDYVSKNPKSEMPSVVNFPVHVDNPYKIDVVACKKLLEEYRPQLIILGKSMIIHREPVAAIRKYIDELGLYSILMYDMAHVLGLIGPHFQQPFAEGADLVTGSTHKTYFGTQRGVIGGNFEETAKEYPLWEAIERRAFPGSVSNHHLGTMLGLLMAAYEMNAFKDSYQQQVISNAKSFARALKDCGLNVAGDSGMDFTETHQVVVEVGWSKGAQIAMQLENNNIIVNYQATPSEEGFSASGAIRIGVSEMTRFGMKEKDFHQAAQFFSDVILKGKTIKEEVLKFRQKFQDMQYCFNDSEFNAALDGIGELIW